MKTTLYEEPRLREQSFGNFQDLRYGRKYLAERHRYGSFFYKFPNGECAADVYDRCSTFNYELQQRLATLSDPEGTVVVIVAHGISGRIFLMTLLHWSYEVFENVRNLENCELVAVRHTDQGYKLASSLSTWTAQPQPEYGELLDFSAVLPKALQQEVSDELQSGLKNTENDDGAISTVNARRRGGPGPEDPNERTVSKLKKPHHRSRTYRKRNPKSEPLSEAELWDGF